MKIFALVLLLLTSKNGTIYTDGDVLPGLVDKAFCEKAAAEFLKELKEKDIDTSHKYEAFCLNTADGTTIRMPKQQDAGK